MTVFPSPTAASATTFWGYPRRNRLAGTRNLIGVLVVGNCASTAARRVAAWFTPERLADFPNVDGVVPFVHELGCGMEKSGEPLDLLRRSLGGSIRNPNLAGAVVMALGCERNNIYAFLEQEGLEAGPLLKTVVLQEVGGTARGIEDGVAAVQAMLPEVNATSRQPVSLSKLVLGLQAADMASAAPAIQAALGHAIDHMVNAGATVLVSNTRQAAPALLPRAASAQVAGQLEARIHWWKDYTAGRAAREPAPVAPGLAFAGTTPVAAAIGYGHAITAKGLVFMDSPGYEAISATGQVASGANLVTVMTRSGSAFGAAGAPTVKVAIDSAVYAEMADDLDFDAGEGQVAADTQALGQRLAQCWIDHASGHKTRSEDLGLGDDEFVPWPIGVLA